MLAKIRMGLLSAAGAAALALAPSLGGAQTSGGSMSGGAMNGGAMSGHAMVDCANSHATMTTLMNPSQGPFSAMSGTATLDQNYGSSQLQIAKLQAALAKIELACGKDAKAKVAAQKALDEANAMQLQLDAMMHTN